MPGLAAIRFVQFAVESCIHMGWAAPNFMSALGDVASVSVRTPKDAFVRWAMQLLFVALQERQCGGVSPVRFGAFSGAGRIRSDSGLGVSVLPDEGTVSMFLTQSGCRVLEICVTRQSG